MSIAEPNEAVISKLEAVIWQLDNLVRDSATFSLELQEKPLREMRQSCAELLEVAINERGGYVV